MNNLRAYIDLDNGYENDSRFVVSKKINGDSLFLADLKNSAIKIFDNVNDVELIRRSGDNKFVVARKDYEKGKGIFEGIELSGRGFTTSYSYSYDLDNRRMPKDLIVGNSSTYLLKGSDSDTIFNSDLSVKISADRFEKKTIDVDGQKVEIIKGTDYVKKGNITDTVNFYINPITFESKGFYSRIQGLNDPLDESHNGYIPMYQDEDLIDDKEYNALTSKGAKIVYRCKKTYNDKITMKIMEIYTAEKEKAYDAENEADKVLTKKFKEV